MNESSASEAGNYSNIQQLTNNAHENITSLAEILLLLLLLLLIIIIIIILTVNVNVNLLISGVAFSGVGHAVCTTVSCRPTTRISGCSRL